MESRPHPPSSLGNGDKCQFLSRLEPAYHRLISPLLTVTKYLESFLTYAQIETSETVCYPSVHNNLLHFFKTLHISCGMLVEHVRCQDQIQVPRDLKRIQKVTHYLHNLLIELRMLFVRVEKKGMDYERLPNPRELLGPNYNTEEEARGRVNVFVCRVIVEEALNMLHELGKVLSGLH